MGSTQRPSLAARTLSTPLTSVNISPYHQQESSTLGLNVLTPPTSPRHARSSTGLKGDDSSRLAVDCESVLQTTKNGLLVCPFEVEILRDHHHRNQIFGHGAWSNVFKGTCHIKQFQNSGLATPPPSPVPRPPFLVAVKQPSRKDANTILLNEGKILSSLMLLPNHERHVLTFYGIIAPESSLVLAAHPLSLEQHIVSCAKRARANLSISNMFTPVIGSTLIWMNLANQLVSALDWLHNDARVIHGDIKPGNILLESLDVEVPECLSFRPLLADFSSGQTLDSQDITPNTLSAVTKEYTAPELLSSSVLRDPKATATPASDVFSMAVTLLVAATGNTMVYPGSTFQRQTMATQGWQVISFARNGDQGLRVPNQGVVSRALERAVLKMDMGRISAAGWKELLEKMNSAEEPSKL